jgi:hypothetical protein
MVMRGDAIPALSIPAATPPWHGESFLAVQLRLRLKRATSLCGVYLSGQIEPELTLNMKPVTTKITKKTVKKSIPAAAPLTAAPTAPTSVAPAPKPTPVRVVAAPAKVATPTRATTVSPTTIEAKIDVGFGNQLFLRGQGAGLSWERGIPLECVDSKTWRLTVPAQEKLLFKVLLNDSIWSKGEDVVVTPGQRVEITPAF